MSRQLGKRILFLALAAAIVLVTATAIAAAPSYGTVAAQGPSATQASRAYGPAMEHGTPAAGTWLPAANMATARMWHTATLLPSGQVLVAGGKQCQRRSGQRRAVRPGQQHLVAGGEHGHRPAEHHGDPAALGPGAGGRGRGAEPAASLASAELYDPASNTWSPAASMSTARDGHTATLLASGQVLVAGGCDGISGTPGQRRAVRPGQQHLVAGGEHEHRPRRPHGHPAALGQGAGGRGREPGSEPASVLASAELYDPASNTWSPAASMSTARERHTATLLPSGQVLVAGGENQHGGHALASAELYDPASNTWSPAGSMSTARRLTSATLLPSGQVLVAGGFDDDITCLGQRRAIRPGQQHLVAGGEHEHARVGTRPPCCPRAGVGTGGFDNHGVALASAELYNP